MFCIFITGTAASGKSLLTSALVPWYEEMGSYAASLNLDPGAASLPYSPDIDIRDYIDFQAVMEDYQLGPNGALVLASDLIATRIGELQSEIDEVNPDYLVIDTPGQVELFSYRSSGPFIVDNLRCDGKVVIFLFDATLVSSAMNFVSIALLAASLQLRLKAPHIPILSKRDLVGDAWKRILRWSAEYTVLEDALAKEGGGQEYLLISGILQELVKVGFAYGLIPVSSVTREGMVELSAALSRILTGGEEGGD